MYLFLYQWVRVLFVKKISMILIQLYFVCCSTNLWCLAPPSDLIYHLDEFKANYIQLDQLDEDEKKLFHEKFSSLNKDERLSKENVKIKKWGREGAILFFSVATSILLGLLFQMPVISIILLSVLFWQTLRVASKGAERNQENSLAMLSIVASIFVSILALMTVLFSALTAVFALFIFYISVRTLVGIDEEYQESENRLKRDSRKDIFIKYLKIYSPVIIISLILLLILNPLYAMFVSLTLWRLQKLVYDSNEFNLLKVLASGAALTVLIVSLLFLSIFFSSTAAPLFFLLSFVYIALWAFKAIFDHPSKIEEKRKEKKKISYHFLVQYPAYMEVLNSLQGQNRGAVINEIIKEHDKGSTEKISDWGLAFDDYKDLLNLDAMDLALLKLLMTSTTVKEDFEKYIEDEKKKEFNVRDKSFIPYLLLGVFLLVFSLFFIQFLVPLILPFFLGVHEFSHVVGSGFTGLKFWIGVSNDFPFSFIPNPWNMSRSFDIPFLNLNINIFPVEQAHTRGVPLSDSLFFGQNDNVTGFMFGYKEVPITSKEGMRTHLFVNKFWSKSGFSDEDMENRGILMRTLGPFASFIFSSVVLVFSGKKIHEYANKGYDKHKEKIDEKKDEEFYKKLAWMTLYYVAILFFVILGGIAIGVMIFEIAYAMSGIGDFWVLNALLFFPFYILIIVGMLGALAVKVYRWNRSEEERQVLIPVNDNDLLENSDLRNFLSVKKDLANEVHANEDVSGIVMDGMQVKMIEDVNKTDEARVIFVNS